MLSVPLLVLLSIAGRVNGFVTPSRATARTVTAPSSPLYAVPPAESNDDQKRRMELVRSLQDTYYKSENGDAPVLNEATGVMENLPLWRVQWTELPGRSNVLNVHDPTYTNMFETIVNRPKPWYFGHLFLPGGSKSLQSGKYEYELKNWRDDAANVDRSNKSRTSVVGTLMKIADFRRLDDGRLCILVHAMERFVVKDALQNVPYSIANVQILPDYEALSENEYEEQAAEDRARATVESFQYHDYEYYEKPLPLPEEKFMTQADVYGSWLTDVLPFVPYNLDKSLLPAGKTQAASTEAPVVVGVDLSLEKRLVENQILKDPWTHPRVALPRTGMSNDDLETFIWNAIGDFCGAKRVEIPLEILCLLPPGRSWLLPEESEASLKNRVSSGYPAARRQARLSYAAGALVEMTELGLDMRQVWLESPSTNARLADLLERFEIINEITLGKFQ
jgi:Lon protease-like protein